MIRHTFLYCPGCYDDTLADRSVLWHCGLHVLTAVTRDADLSAKTSASPWDPVHSSSAPNGAHAMSGGIVAAGGIDDEFDLLSSRSRSPPTTTAGTCSISLLDTRLVE